MNKAHVKEVLINLNRIKSGDFEPYFGICSNIGDLEFPVEPIIHHYFERWPKFSGIKDYPVPDPKSKAKTIRGKRKACQKIYAETWDKALHWDKNTEYGRLRHELLDFMIIEMKKDLKKGNME